MRRKYRLKARIKRDSLLQVAVPNFVMKTSGADGSTDNTKGGNGIRKRKGTSEQMDAVPGVVAKRQRLAMSDWVTNSFSNLSCINCSVNSKYQLNNGVRKSIIALEYRTISQLHSSQPPTVRG